MEKQKNARAFRARSGSGKAKSATGADWVKWIGLSITLSGIAAWCAGEAYILEYWNAAGLSAEVSQRSSQELAFVGFVGSFSNWFFLLLFFASISLYVLLLEFFSTFGRKKERSRGKLGRWLQAKFSDVERTGRMDPAIARACAAAIAVAVGLGVLVVLPLGAWVAAAGADGRNLMTRQICQIRAAKALPSSVILGDGRKLAGKFLLRSEKTSILLDRTSIYIVQLGEKPLLQDITDVGQIPCGR